MLARFERLMEQAVEGSLRRVFATSLQPIQLAKAAARAMEQGQVIGPRGSEVPNLYELRLAPADAQRFAGYAETLRREIVDYLHEYARERGLRLVAVPRIALIEDSTLRVGSVRARARFEGLATEVQQEVDAAIEGTRRLRLADLAAARQARQTRTESRLRLVGAAGLEFALEPELDVVRIGRAADNDIVLESKNVSRYHAQLRWVVSNWLVYDLSSTNGTWVDQRRLAPGAAALVCDGLRLRFGDYDVQVKEVRGAGRRGRG